MRILQFGEGVFLRGFFDWMVERMNRAGLGWHGDIEIVRPRGAHPSAVADALRASGLFSVSVKGIQAGAVVDELDDVRCVRTCLNPVSEWPIVEEIATDPDCKLLVSNTTEAGIVYQPNVDTFPAKVARLLTARCRAGCPGMIVLPCELIERNGEALRECVLRYVSEADVRAWIEQECRFYNTLVDRIVWAGEGVTDVCTEPFTFFAIEAPASLESEIPFQSAGLNVVYTKDLSQYRTRKVRFLNGAHTAFVHAGLLAGYTFVNQLMEDSKMRDAMRKMLLEEVSPTVPLPDAEKRAYADSVLERFANPFARHRLQSIAMNSVSKWRVRILPTIRDNERMKGTPPPFLVSSLFDLIHSYQKFPFEDSPEVKAFFSRNPRVEDILAEKTLWGEDLRRFLFF